MPKLIKISRLHMVSIFIFLIASLFYIYEFALQVSPSVITSDLMRTFSVDATRLGLLGASFFFTYTIMQLPGGLILDRFGARMTLTVVGTLCAFGALIFSEAVNLPMAAFGRILMGIGGAFAFNSVLYLILRWFPPAYFAFFVGLLQILCTVGAIGGGSVLAILTEKIGWRHAMALFALIGFIIVVISWAGVRNQPYDPVNAEREEARLFKNLKEIIKNPQTWLIAIYSVSIWAPMVGFSALWGIPFLKTSEHLSSVGAANAIAFSWIGAATASPVIGWLSDQIKHRNMLLTSVAFLGFTALLILIFIPNLSYTTTLFLLFLVGVSASGQSLIFAVVKDINRFQAVSTANGFNNMAVVIGGLLFQPLIGKLLDWRWSGVFFENERIYTLSSYQIALTILPVCCLIATVVSLFFIRETYCKPAFPRTR